MRGYGAAEEDRLEFAGEDDRTFEVDWDDRGEPPPLPQARLLGFFWGLSLQFHKVLNHSSICWRVFT